MRHPIACTFIAVAVAVALPLGAQPALAFKATEAKILDVQPVQNGALQVARVAPYAVGVKERWRVRAHFVVKNNGEKTIKLIQTQIWYPGMDSATKSVKDGDEDPNVDSRIIGPGKAGVFIIDDGMARPPFSGGDRNLYFPVAAKARISVRFENYSDPVSREFPLQTYVNKTPEGSYQFPAKHREVAAGEHWSVGIHAFSRGQKFGYDFGVSRWDAAAKKWTGLKPGAGAKRKNTDYLVFGKPVYAMAPGTIIQCVWSAPDNSRPGVKDSKGQNQFVIDHGNGEIALYAHFKAGSVNDKLCPKGVKEYTYGLKIPVRAGEYLGRAGNSGASTAPHLHVHLETAANGGIPLLFRGIRNVSTGVPEQLGPGPFAFNTVQGQVPGAPFNLIDLQP